MNETTKTKPTLDKSEKDPGQANQFYNKLKSVIKKVRSKDNLIIAGKQSLKTTNLIIRQRNSEQQCMPTLKTHKIRQSKTY